MTAWECELKKLDKALAKLKRELTTKNTKYTEEAELPMAAEEQAGYSPVAKQKNPAIEH